VVIVAFLVAGCDLGARSFWVAEYAEGERKGKERKLVV